jgi:hypothetical protein
LGKTRPLPYSHKKVSYKSLSKKGEGIFKFALPVNLIFCRLRLSLQVISVPVDL